MRYETLLKLFFGYEIGNELPVLQGSVNTLEQIKDTSDTHLYYLLTAKFGVKVYEAYL